MQLILKEKRAARVGSLKVLDFATTRCPPACERWVDLTGLKQLFAIFMGKSKVLQPCVLIVCVMSVKTCLLDMFKVHQPGILICVLFWSRPFCLTRLKCISQASRLCSVSVKTWLLGKSQVHQEQCIH